MNTFYFDRDRAQPFEQLVVDLFESWGIEAGLNPYSGTEDPRRADYDVWLYSPDSGLTLECKMDWKSEQTGNICVELEALSHSSALLFLYGLPYDRHRLYIHTFELPELEKLCCATRLTYQSREWKYPHLQVGDQIENVGVLIPRAELHRVGQPLWPAAQKLTQHA